MQKKNRTLRLFMVLILTISTVATGIMPVSVAASPFTDVPSDAYYAEPVAWAVENNITKGTSDSTFSPDNGCTRAQVVAFLWRAAGQPDATKTSDFSDVAKDEYYTKAVSWAVEKEITKGIGDGKFDPDSTCTRAQIVTFLWRYKNSPASSKDSGFSDVSAGQYYAEPVTWAVQNEITQGVGNNQFAPNNTCTRAQVVTFLMRCSNLKTDVDLASANVGDYVTFGHYEQDNNTANGKEAIEWKVLDKKDGRALLISKYGLDHKKYNETHAYVTWEICTLRSWLNGEFLNTAFSSSEKSVIPTVTLSNPDNLYHGTQGGNNTNDRVFLLSLQEMQQYFSLSDTWTDYDKFTYDVNDKRNDYIGGSKDVITSPTAYAEAQGVWASSLYHDAEGKTSCEWWLRSPGDGSNCAANVRRYGGVVSNGSLVGSNQLAVRPALWVDLVS